MKVNFNKIIMNVKSYYYTYKAKKVIQSFTEPLLVNYKSSFSRNTFLGKNTNFNGIEIAGNGVVKIGDNFHSGTDVLIITQNHNYEGESIPYDDTYTVKNVNIEDNVWIGSRVIILGGINIGEGSIIQAGSVVVSDIPKYSIAGGSPAKVFKSRDIKHYKELKKQGNFF